MDTINSFWYDRTVFVTGGAGFLGAYLVRYLVDHGAHVLVLLADEDPRSNFFQWELDKQVVCVRGVVENYTLLKRLINEYEVQTVFHLAAQPLVTVAYRDPLATFESNIRGTYHVLEACRHGSHITEVVVASSDKAYGIHTSQPYTESHALHGNHPYDVSKSCADLLAQTYSHTYGLPVVITRSGNFYGGGDLYFDRIVPHTIKQYISGKAPQLRSDGTHIRDYVYVKDVVSAYITLAEQLQLKQLQGHAFNFGHGKGVSVLEIVSLIKRLCGSSREPVILDIARAEIPEQYVATDKIQSLIGWEPHYSLEQGLLETISWYKQYLGDVHA